MKLLILLCIGSTLAKKCSQICGDVEEVQNKHEIIENRNKIDNRIVNGYQVSDRGFMVLIRAIDPGDKDNYETCGGALINSQYVLTAGHCVCLQTSNSNVMCYQGQLKYDPKKVLHLFIGLQDMNIGTIHKPRG